MDLNFEQLLASHNQEFKEAEVYNNWMPPDGEYIASVVKLTTGSSTKDGVDLVWWRLTGRIEDVQDEKLNGKEFSIGYYTSKAFGILKGAVKTLAGQIIHDLAEAHIILEASIGKVLRVKVDTRPGKGANAGKEFTNCYIQEVIDTSAETVGAAISADNVPDVANPAPIEAPAEYPADGTPLEAPVEVPLDCPVTEVGPEVIG